MEALMLKEDDLEISCLTCGCGYHDDSVGDVCGDRPGRLEPCAGIVGTTTRQEGRARREVSCRTRWPWVQPQSLK